MGKTVTWLFRFQIGSMRFEDRIRITVDFVCDSVPASISGTVTSEGDANAPVLIQLIPKGSSDAAYITTVKGNSASYSIEGIAAGTYTLKITKNGHGTYEETVTVSGDVTKDVTLKPIPEGEGLLGDVNCDGVVNSIDSNLLKRSIAGEYYIETDSEAYINADMNSDGIINAVDSNLLKRQIAGQ